jgi:2-iminobutanoate/2-iminopropanoate deaminase
LNELTPATISTLNPESLGPAIAPYSQATVANGFCFIAGQVGLDPNNEVIAPGDVRAQTTASIERMETILADVGASLSDIVTATVFLVDVADFGGFNEAWAEKFGDHRPARATVRADLLLEGLVVEIQAIAVVSD